MSQRKLIYVSQPTWPRKSIKTKLIRIETTNKVSNTLLIFQCITIIAI